MLQWSKHERFWCGKVPYNDWVVYMDLCNFCAASGPETSELLEWLLFILTLSSKREMLWTLSLALVVTWIGVFLLIHLPNTTLIISQSEVLYCMWCCPIVWIRSQCLLAAGLHLSCWVLNSKSPSLFFLHLFFCNCNEAFLCSCWVLNFKCPSLFFFLHLFFCNGTILQG